MAMITLYKDKVNSVGSFIDDIIKSSSNMNAQLNTLKTTLQGIDSSTCDLQDTVNSISSSSKSEREKVKDLKKLNEKLTEFIETARKCEDKAETAINKKKKDFYSKYSYLKPDCEKKFIDKVVSKVESFGKWCADHWKFIATIVIVALAVVVIVCSGGWALGPLATFILVGAAKGALIGAAIGGLSGGVTNWIAGGFTAKAFFEGAESGAFSGALSGAITGGLSAKFGWTNAAKPFFGSVTKPAMWKECLMAGGADAFTSIVSDLGDIFIAGEDISFGEFMTDTVLSFATGYGTTFGLNKISQKLPDIKIKVINGKGKNTWYFDWMKSVGCLKRKGTGITAKTIWKSIGMDVVDDVWNTVAGSVKDLGNNYIDNITGSDETAVFAY